MSLFDGAGRRLYLNAAERAAFERAIKCFPPEVRTFAAVMLHTGCRISEALALTAERVDLNAGTLVFESLKKRRSGVFRAVPVPDNLIKQIQKTHNLRVSNARLWLWSRRTAYTRIVEIMHKAGISGVCATPKGLRHGFAVACIEHQITLNLVQKWLGHASISTTAIYANAVGQEEREIAARMWA